jgi:hypothetical protein
VSGAGCPRVTHPFAALPSGGLPLPRFPLDLHVLGTPPAFVLSQDQTLRREPLDPAPSFPWAAGFRVHSGKPASPGSTPGSASCDAVYDRLVPGHDEIAPFPRRGNALAFGTLFSSQGASADPKKDSKRWGRATHYCRHADARRQPSARSPLAGTLSRRPAPIPAAGNRRFTHLAGAKGSSIGSKQRACDPRMHPPLPPRAVAGPRPHTSMDDVFRRRPREARGTRRVEVQARSRSRDPWTRPRRRRAGPRSPDRLLARR